MRRFRIGSVPYLNARPIVSGATADGALSGVTGLDRVEGIEYSEHLPSRLADLLAAGELDCALVSSIEAKRIAGAEILDAPCIASDGPVWSVRLFGESDPAHARTVALDGASRTSAALARVIYSRFLNRTDVEYREVGPAPEPRDSGADATLVIGDAALRRLDSPLASLDLGEAWTRATGLPFVWAVWLAGPGVRPDERPALERILWSSLVSDPAALRALAIEHAPTCGVTPEIAEAYLTRIIRYRMETRERDGLARFFELAS